MSDFMIWEKRLTSFIEAVKNIGGETEGIIIKPPTTLSEVRIIEEKLGYGLPQSFVHVLTNYSRGMEVNWSLPSDDELSIPLPKELSGLFACHFSWSINDILSVDEGRKGWETEVFPNSNDPYDAIWHNKLAFMEVGNGDYIAFDLSVTEDPPIVYLSHDDGKGHGIHLGNNFYDFFNKWTQIGCVGCEDWQILPFIIERRLGIDPVSDNANLWRSWLNIKNNM